MIFSSVIFLFVFLPVTLLLYYVLPKKVKNLLLLLASFLFYFWGEAKLVIVLIASICINYFCGLAVDSFRSRKSIYGKLALAMGILLNLALLGYFKYFDFAVEILNMGFGKAIPLKEIILPIGISFYTFQGITYIVDLFRGEVEVQKNPLKIALYISLFPQLVAGPIIRYKDIARQIDDRSLNVDLFYSGAVRFIFGLGKKVIIANNVAAIADAVFSSPADTHSISTAWLGAICFALQLYFDFSGYSDMAIGLGKMFGFEFRENFNYPYISRNIREFWRRWHISLSSFFRDYLYIPLGGNRRGNVYFNLIIVFAATGLWHGAGWTYIVWGLWHGLFIIIENVIKRTPTLARIAEKATAPIFRIFTHIYALLVILIGWVIFRSESISYAAAFLKNMFSFSPSGNIRVSTLYYLDSFHALVLGAAIMLSLPLYPKLAEWIRTKNHNMGMFSVLHIICLGILLVVSMLMIINQGYNPFLYFRF